MTPSALKTYFEDAERVQNEIWRDIDVKGKTVIDVGIGESTKKLIELGAKVVGVDTDPQKIINSKTLDIPLIVCDFLNFPFQMRIADFVVFYFTLHEMDTNLHLKVLTTARKIAPRVMIVEPSPNGYSTYETFAQIWKNAMHSIRKFEDYMPMEYWEKITRKAGFKVVLKRTVEWNASIPSEILEEIVETTLEKWRKMGIGKDYINNLEEFLKSHPEMKWSDVNVIVGEC